MPPHAVNPRDAEYTAAVGRPRSPDRTVHSNASVNQQLLLRQRAGKLACAGWAWYTDAMSMTAILTFRVAPVMSDEPQQTLPPKRAAGRGSDGRVHGRDESERRHSNWQLAAVRPTAAGCGDWHAAAHLHGHWPRLTQWVGWNGEISGVVYMGRYLFIAWRGRDARVAT